MSPQWLDDPSEPHDGEPKPAQAGPAPRGSFEVGYGRPPISTRFKQGNRANPKGRPRGSKNFRTLLNEKLDTKVQVSEGGRKRMMSKREIGITKFVNKFAETGDLKQVVVLTRLDDPWESSKSAAALANTMRSDADSSVSDADFLKWVEAALRASAEKQSAPVTQGVKVGSDDEQG